MIPELSGIEFDWFATDQDGELAIFATAGEGTVPSSVQRNHHAHSEVSDTLVVPHWGTAQVWGDYAALGLFVYDWALPEGPYERRAVPASPPSEAMRAQLRKITELPQFSVSFSRVTLVTP